MDRRSMVFEPAINPSVVDTVIAQFEALIIDGVLREGMKLPPERELAARFEVSRDKLREALRTLEQEELIVARQGDGTYVAQLTGTALAPAMVRLYARHSRGFEHYLEYRREIEGFVAKLAAERATDTDKQVIADCIERQAAAVERGDREMALKEDINFHTAIAQAAHNSMVTHTTTSVYALTEMGIFYNREALREMQTANEELLRQHQAIADAINKGAPTDALNAAHAHIDYVSKAVREANQKALRHKVAQNRRATRDA